MTNAPSVLSNEVERNDLRVLTETEHHNIPTSCGGTEDQQNRTMLPAERHALFHETFADNRSPDALIRLLLTSSIGKRGAMPSIRTLSEVFQITRNPAELYEPGTIDWPLRNGAIECRKTQLLEQIVVIRQTIEALEGKGKFPGKQPGIIHNACKFFDPKQKDITAVLERFCTETHNGELAWAKPITYHARTQLAQLMNRSTLQPLLTDERGKQTLIAQLQNEEKRLQRQIDTLEEGGSSQKERQNRGQRRSTKRRTGLHLK